MPKRARIRRVWQTVSLSGPLYLSGIASIVKTYVSFNFLYEHSSLFQNLPDWHTLL